MIVLRLHDIYRNGNEDADSSVCSASNAYQILVLGNIFFFSSYTYTEV